MGDLRSFFAAGKTAPIGNTRYPSGCGLTQRRHPAVPPDTTLSPRPFPSGPPALGLRLLPPRPTQPSPRTAGKIRLVGNPATRNIVRPENPPRPGNPPARNIVRPGKSTSPGKSAGPTLIPPGTRPVRLCPAPLSFTGTFYAPFPSPQHVPRIAPPAEWHAP